jgi:hypothetical protein
MTQKILDEKSEGTAENALTFHSYSLISIHKNIKLSLSSEIFLHRNQMLERR